jgi:hypothetical protein
MKKPLLKDYSVVGIYADNQQPWITWVRASTLKEAALKGIKKTYNKGQNGVELKDIFVVDVIKGKVKGCLSNDKVVSLKDIEEA